MDFLGKIMKLKPIYFYTGLIVIVIAFLFITSRNNSNIIPGNNIQNSEIPQDEIHKGMTPPGQPAPNKSNVSAAIIKQMEILKKDMEWTKNESYPNDSNGLNLRGTRTKPYNPNGGNYNRHCWMRLKS